MPSVQSWLHLLPLDFKHTKNLFIKILLKSLESTIIFPTSCFHSPTYDLTLLFFNFSVLELLQNCVAPQAWAVLLLSFPRLLDDVKDIKQLFMYIRQPAAPRAHLGNNS